MEDVQFEEDRFDRPVSRAPSRARPTAIVRLLGMVRGAGLAKTDEQAAYLLLALSGLCLFATVLLAREPQPPSQQELMREQMYSHEQAPLEERLRTTR